jgi:hypothetical protein
MDSGSMRELSRTLPYARVYGLERGTIYSDGLAVVQSTQHPRYVIHHEVPAKLSEPRVDSTPVKIYTLFSGSVASFL